ncbi:hypothetical protein [Petroclostridium xylanilyticum]|nr:hypothetical protein [Petroclostridium xylanilyticum]
MSHDLAGLAIRVIDDIVKEKFEIIKEADILFKEEIATAGLQRDLH